MRRSGEEEKLVELMRADVAQDATVPFRFPEPVGPLGRIDAVWTEAAGSNLARLIAAWDPQRMDCLLMLALGAAAVGYDGRGDFSLGGDGRIRRRREQEVVPFVFTGVQILHPRAFAATPEGAFSNNLVWNHAMLAGRAYGMRMEGLWMHVGSPAELAAAEQAIAAIDVAAGAQHG